MPKCAATYLFVKKIYVPNLAYDIRIHDWKLIWVYALVWMFRAWISTDHGLHLRTIPLNRPTTASHVNIHAAIHDSQLAFTTPRLRRHAQLCFSIRKAYWSFRY
jgi:hypothetical protein